MYFICFIYSKSKDFVASILYTCNICNIFAKKKPLALYLLENDLFQKEKLNMFKYLSIFFRFYYELL